MFALWFFKRRKVVDLGGSMAQAQIVYDYVARYIESNPVIAENLGINKPLMSNTSDKEGNYVKCLTASSKSVRGPHPDGLLCDEVVEADDDIILSALPMVDSSENPFVVMASTFHKVYGIFQDYWDQAIEKGYKRYEWDIFDVAKKFNKEIWDDPVLKREISDLDKLKELAKGRTGDKNGFISIQNIIQAWREKDSYDYFLVEYMGQRPSAEGLVLNPVDIDACTVEEGMFNENDLLGAEFSMGIDWGFSSMTAIVDFVKLIGDKKELVYNKTYTQTDLNVIIDDVVQRCKNFPRKIIYADSSGKFENRELQLALKKENLGTAVVEIIFSKEKEELLGNLRAHFQNHNLIIPKKFQTALWQYKRYRYQPGTDKPVKENDHIPDATICALKPWKRQRTKTNVQETKEKIKRTPITGGLLDKRF